MSDKKADIAAFIYNTKQEHEHLFKIDILNTTFIYRPLTKYEYEQLLVINKDNIPHHVMAENICKLCVLFPENYDFETNSEGGIAETLFRRIKKDSLFTHNEEIKQVADEFRHLHEDDMTRRMENMIITAFPNIRLEEIKNWDIYKLLDYFSRAEWIIQNIRSDTHLPGDPGEQGHQQGANQEEINQALQEQLAGPPQLRNQQQQNNVY